MKKALITLCTTLLLAGCIKATAPAGLDLDEKEVLSRVKLAMPTACEYKGRAILQYEEALPNGTSDIVRFQTVVDKQCTNDMIVRVLGSFGMVEAELAVTNGVYRVFRKGEDVSESQPVQLTEDDMLLVEYYLNFPPPLPDENSLMIVSEDHYSFIKDDDTYIYVDKDFYVDRIVTATHEVAYLWQADKLAAMIFDRENVKVSVEFAEPWR